MVSDLKGQEGETKVTRHQAENIAINSLERAGFKEGDIYGNSEVTAAVKQFGLEHEGETVNQTEKDAVTHFEEMKENEFKKETAAEGEVVRLEEASITGKPPLTDGEREKLVKEAKEEAYYAAQKKLAERREEHGLGEAPKREGPDISLAQAEIQEKEIYRKWQEEHPEGTLAMYRMEQRGEQPRGITQPKPIEPEYEIAKAEEPVQKAPKEETEKIMVFTEKEVFGNLAENEPKELDEGTKDLLDTYGQVKPELDAETQNLARIARERGDAEREERRIKTGATEVAAAKEEVMEFTPEEVAEYHKENPPPVAPVAAAPKEEAPKIALSDPKLVSAVEKRAGAKPHNDYTEEKVEELSTWVGEVGKLAEEMNVPQGELINTYDKAKVKEPKPVEVAAEVTAAPVAEEALKEPVEVAHVEEKEIVPIVPEEAHVEESPKVATVPIEEVSAPPEKVAKAEEPRAPPKEKITADTISDRLMAKFNIGGNDTVSDVLGGGEKIKGGGELSDQIETGQIATQTESSLSGPAKGKVDDVAAETKHGGVAGGDKVVKTVGPGEEREAPRMRAKVETVGKGEKGVEISVADLERTINRRVIELAQSSVIRNSERFLDTYGVARENFKNGKENGLSQDESQMKGWAKEASNSREKILELLPELRNFQKMCDALKENDSESTALKGAQRTLREIEGVLARWEEA